MTEDRYEKLKSLLPPVDSPYSVDELSAAETAAFEEALYDGFGYRSVESMQHDHVESGLLRYSCFHIDHSRAEELNLPPFEVFPLKFKMEGLRLYFANQLDRYRGHLAREEGGDWEEPGYSGLILGIMLREWTLKKPWYEYHVVQFLDWINGGLYPIGAISHLHLTWCGQLGRLVEQYDWKFRFEKAAITGVGARTGASRGGESTAKKMREQQSRWQTLASDIWKRRPQLSKMAVAEQIKKQLDELKTAKHIARYISQPKS
jgi:hypothetical protein